MADDEMQTPEDEAATDADASADEAAMPEDASVPDAGGDAVLPDGDEPTAEAELSEDQPAADDATAEVVAEDEAAPPAAPATAGGEPISQEDIDQLFAEQGPAPETPVNDQPAGGGVTEVDDGALGLLGDAATTLTPFGVKAKETLSLGIESAAGQSITIASTAVTGAEYNAIEQEFAGIPHLGFELRVSLSETESHLVGALVPLPDAGALFSIDTSPDQMEDEAFAQAQLDAAAGTMRELLDLVSLTLFTEGLSAAEVTLSDQRVDMPEFTMGIVADVAQGAAPLRVELVLALPGGIPVTLTLVVPSSLATRIAEMVAESSATAAAMPEPTPIDSARMAEAPAATAAGGGGGTSATGGFASAPDFPSEAPQRPAATIGASPDVDVHPVRFPPLPELEAPLTAQRGLDLIMDVQMRVSVELGRSTMTVEDVLSLGPGSVVELNKLAGEAVDILVNERLIARGEVVVVDENFGVRVTEIVSPRRRAHAMGA